jgi:hypothetical protein
VRTAANPHNPSLSMHLKTSWTYLISLQATVAKLAGAAAAALVLVAGPMVAQPALAAVEAQEAYQQVVWQGKGDQSLMSVLSTWFATIHHCHCHLPPGAIGADNH